MCNHNAFFQVKAWNFHRYGRKILGTDMQPSSVFMTFVTETDLQ